MIIEKKGKTYTVTESNSKWTVKEENGKLTVAFEIPKDLCKTESDLRKFVDNNDELF